MIVGQNIPPGTAAKKRAQIIAKRVKKLRKLVDGNRAVKESVVTAALKARQVAIRKAVESNARFKATVGKFLLNPDR